MNRVLALAAAALAALAAGFGVASADGEVGVVIQIGSEVETHCIAYTGESITGEQALVAAGKTLEQFGGSGGRTVCAINNHGCSDASSFSSCFCECQGRDCTYWAFFTREYGATWVYSTLAFNLLKATDGDVHGWKWGAGGPASAPSPVDVTFEQICGHPPASTLPTATATSGPPTATPTQPGSTATSQATQSPTTSGTATTAVATDASSTPSATATPATVEVTIGNTPAPPDTAGNDEPAGGGNGGLIAAGAIGVALVGAIGGAAVWRARRGA